MQLVLLEAVGTSFPSPGVLSKTGVSSVALGFFTTLAVPLTAAVGFGIPLPEQKGFVAGIVTCSFTLLPISSVSTTRFTLGDSLGEFFARVRMLLSLVPFCTVRGLAIVFFGGGWSKTAKVVVV